MAGVMAGGEILEPYELHYSDLMVLSSDKPLSSSSEERERLESITKAVMENLGPTGPGLLVIVGVSKAYDLRRALLPLASKLALLNNEDRKRVLKQHGLGSDVPLKNGDRTVSSFAMLLKQMNGIKSNCAESRHLGGDENSKHNYPHVQKLGESQYGEFQNLRDTFKELGFCMMDVGCQLARMCDKVIGGQELEQSLLESGIAKGRLIHYHSTLDNLILKEAGKRKGSSRGQANTRYTFHGLAGVNQPTTLDQTYFRGQETISFGNQSNLWQQWHYDYGIFTVLTAPMFMLRCHPPASTDGCSCIYHELECPSPIGHTYLQLFDPNKDRILLVKAPTESFIIQVGESADILSKGKLRSSLHSVCRPEKLENMSRETFVVFLQPAWSKTLSLLDYHVEHSSPGAQLSGACCKETHNAERGQKTLTQEIHKIVPPLTSRLKNAMTFAEFARETTKQYYGGSGLQSNR